MSGNDLKMLLNISGNVIPAATNYELNRWF